MFECPGEAPAGGRQIPLLGYQYVDDLPILVNGPVEADPPTGDLDVGFVDEPAILWRVAAERAASISSGANPAEAG
jgi:hypothetical protein